MAFPNVIVECAFDNDVNEYQYAQAGYSDITQWVREVSGDLRGRRYEMERVETGSIRVTLDNHDGRFTPGRVASPYYPFIKPSRRFRIRGENMQRINVATTGTQDHSTKGFAVPTVATSVYTVDAAVPAPTLVEEGSPYTNTHHVTTTWPGTLGNVTVGLLEWNVPIEIGRRTTHSVKVKRVSGTEPTATIAVGLFYFDASGTEINCHPVVSWSNATSTTLTERSISHAPPLDAQYAKMVLYVSGDPTADVVYAVDAISTHNAPSMAPNPSARWDAEYWYVNGPDGTVCEVDATNSAVTATMGASAEDNQMLTFIAGTVPGETYTAVVELRHYNAGGGTPADGSLLLTTDDGMSGTVVAGRGSFDTAVLTFVADSTSQRLGIMKDDLTDWGAGRIVKARRLAVVPGSTSPGLHTDDSSTHDRMTWSRPMPIFEGWVEAWPVRVNATAGDMSIVVNDRLKRIGGIQLQSTWREAMFKDQMQLVIPLDDDPTDAAGEVAQIGTWSSEDQIIEVPLMPTRGDLGASGYVLGVDGPTDSTALDLNPASLSAGYFMAVPFSKDYVAPPPPPPPVKPPPAKPKPPPSTPTYTYKTYVSVFYATWSRTYDGDGSTTWDDTAFMMQGYFDGNRGNTRSLAGFNYSAIKSALAGATIKSCKVTFDNHSTYSFGGGYALIGTHTYASKPSTWSGTYVAERRTSASVAYGGKVTKELGVTIGNEFKAGTTKGVALGPAANTNNVYYAHFHGAGHGAERPYLTITYVKRIRVS